MLPQALENMRDAFQKLKRCQLYSEKKSEILTYFNALVNFLPVRERNALREFNEENGSSSSSGQEWEVKLEIKTNTNTNTESGAIEKLRSTLTEIMKTEAQYNKEFCDIIFDIQMALAWAFPINNKVVYELLLIPDKKEETSQSVDVTAIYGNRDWTSHVGRKY